MALLCFYFYHEQQSKCELLLKDYHVLSGHCDHTWKFKISQFFSSSWHTLINLIYLYLLCIHLTNSKSSWTSSYSYRKWRAPKGLIIHTINGLPFSCIIWWNFSNYCRSTYASRHPLLSTNINFLGFLLFRLVFAWFPIFIFIPFIIKIISNINNT